MVKINGKPVDAAGMTLAEYLETTTYNLKAIVVEHNEAIVPKTQYDSTVLQDEDVVEVVCFVGGG